MGFEYKNDLKELLPDYMELLEEQGKQRIGRWLVDMPSLLAKKGVHQMDSLKGYRY